MRQLRLALLMLGMFVLVITCLFALARRGSFRSSLILYQVRVDGYWTPYVMHDNGSQQQPLATYLGHDLPQMEYYRPRWSPDLKWLATATDQSPDRMTQIARVRLRDGYIDYLTDSDVENVVPEWSPDGSSLLYSTNVTPDTTQINRMNADGTGATALTSLETDKDHGVWSPDGEWIAFIEHRDGETMISRMRPDGSDAQELATVNQIEFVSIALAWSPDSQWIVSSSGGDLFRVRADGSEQVQITADSVENLTPIDRSPSWSPDGQWIAFARSQEDNPEFYDIYRIRPDGSGLQGLTRSTAYKGNPQYVSMIDLPFSRGWMMGLGLAMIAAGVGLSKTLQKSHRM